MTKTILVEAVTRRSAVQKMTVTLDGSSMSHRRQSFLFCLEFPPSAPRPRKRGETKIAFNYRRRC
jgi:hypothetical protein